VTDPLRCLLCRRVLANPAETYAGTADRRIGPTCAARMLPAPAGRRGAKGGPRRGRARTGTVDGRTEWLPGMEAPCAT